MVTPDGVVTLDIAAEPAGALTVSLRCHTGALRTENQDRVGHAAGRFGSLTVVADGVGGGPGGAQAATLAVAEYRALGAGEGDDPDLALRQATGRINHRIESLREQDATLNAMASTAALVLIDGANALVAHLGDSRVYLRRAHELRLLTRDHSVVRKMVEAGVITESEALTHPKGHILSKSLGQAGSELEISALTLQQNDVLLVCSDGLWAYVEESALRDALTPAGHTSADMADALLALALEAGAPDNVGLAVIDIGVYPLPQGVRPDRNRAGPGKVKRILAISFGSLCVAGILVWLYLWLM